MEALIEVPLERDEHRTRGAGRAEAVGSLWRARKSATTSTEATTEASCCSQRGMLLIRIVDDAPSTGGHFDVRLFDYEATPAVPEEQRDDEADAPTAIRDTDVFNRRLNLHVPAKLRSRQWRSERLMPNPCVQQSVVLVGCTRSTIPSDAQTRVRASTVGVVAQACHSSRGGMPIVLVAKVLRPSLAVGFRAIHLSTQHHMPPRRRYVGREAPEN